MRNDQAAELSEYLEGRRVSVALVDGSRIDDCELVSASHHGAKSLWPYTNGADIFVPLAVAFVSRSSVAARRRQDRPRCAPGAPP